MTQDLVVRQTDVGIFLPPETVLANAQVAAKALTAIIALKKKPVIMNGEQYLEFEVRGTPGQFDSIIMALANAHKVDVAFDCAQLSMSIEAH